MFAPDPHAAPVVRRIFEEYLRGRGLRAIAQGLTADGVPRPSAQSTQRRPGVVVPTAEAWSKATVRAIIVNPRYAARPTSCGRPPDCSACDRRCAGRRLVPLVPAEVYERTRSLLTQRSDASRAERQQDQAVRYLLRGLLRCELCQRLMQGNWNNGEAYYRCQIPPGYLRTNDSRHPANIYVRERRLVEPLLNWICRSLPVHLHGWAEQQPQAGRGCLMERIRGLRGLVHEATQDRGRSVALYHSLNIRLAYGTDKGVVQVWSEISPDFVVRDTIQL